MAKTFYSIHDYYISHHGIKGQKWGVRRFQNSDGTLTEEGKKRYSRYTDPTAKENKMLYERTKGPDITLKRGDTLSRVTYWGNGATASSKRQSRKMEERGYDKFLSIEKPVKGQEGRTKGSDFYTDIFTRSGATKRKAEVTRYAVNKDLKIAGGDKVWDVVNRVWGDTNARAPFNASRAIQYGLDSLTDAGEHINKATSDVFNSVKVKDLPSLSKSTKPLNPDSIAHVLTETMKLKQAGKTGREIGEARGHRSKEILYYKNRETFIANALRGMANTVVNDIAFRNTVKQALGDKFDGIVDINDPDASGSVILFDPKDKISRVSRESAKKYIKQNPKAIGSGSGNFGRRYWS